MRLIFFVMLAGMVVFFGCKTLEPESDTSLPLKLSRQFSVPAADKSAVAEPSSKSIEKSPDKLLYNFSNQRSGSWWHFLNSDDLDHLIKQALASNFDLKILDARLAQARANISKADAAFFPSLDFSFGGQKKQTRVKTSSGSSPQTDGSHSWDGSLSGSYSPDVWGEATSDKKAVVMSHNAAAQDLNAARFELTVNIAQTWVEIIAARHKKQILNEQIKTNNIVLELLKLRFINGKATALDVSQQQEAIAEANAQLPLLEKQEQILIRTLALLSGKTTADGIALKTVPLVKGPTLPEIGIPSDLLENRSDIQAAKMRLFSAQWDIKAAKADLLPSFTLTARALFSSGQLDLLFQNWVATLAASITGPLFDGGQRRAEIERVTAVVQEKVNLYASVVAKAVFEVEDSLVSIQKQDEYAGLLEQELAIAKRTLQNALVQYQNGQSSYLNYLTAQAGVQRLERQLAGEQAVCVKERIGLYKALGDGGLSGMPKQGDDPDSSDRKVE